MTKKTGKLIIQEIDKNQAETEKNLTYLSHYMKIMDKSVENSFLKIIIVHVLINYHSWIIHI